MKICLFGIYNSEYSRNRVLISGFKSGGYEVIECKVNPNGYSMVSKYIGLYKEYKKIKHLDFRYVIIAFPGHTVVWLARILFGKKIIFDAFISLYNSEIEDRKLHSKFSIYAIYYLYIDWFSCVLSDRVLLDTDAHIDYFVKRFNICKYKFIRVFVGTTKDIFYPKNVSKNSDKFIVHFHGNFIPLQGIEYIIESAKILQNKKNIIFRIIGSGQEYKKIKKLVHKYRLNNIEFIKKVSLRQLGDLINEANICLGIFGNTLKTQMVIPNKIYESIAAKKPLVTCNSRAVKELFIDRVHCIFCKPNDSEDLADKIVLLYRDAVLRNSIAENGYNLFLEKLTPDLLVRDLIKNLE